ncbi:hypothetical protein ACOMHN_034332 [Nucella lapillus]
MRWLKLLLFMRWIPTAGKMSSDMSPPGPPGSCLYAQARPPASTRAPANQQHVDGSRKARVGVPTWPPFPGRSSDLHSWRGDSTMQRIGTYRI